jgi:plastocyanin
MEQRAERLYPHALPVVAGTTVGFPNGDPLFRNVSSLSAARTFDLGRYPSGRSKSVTFAKPGVVQLFCHVHADTRGTCWCSTRRCSPCPTPRAATRSTT